MFKIIVFVGMVLFLGITLCFAQGEEDSITITTYYPSPYGVYKTLRLYPNDSIDPTFACTNPGEMYYDLSDSQVYVCDGSNGQWQPSGGAGGYWATSGDDIYNTNIGNVGIGTQTPLAPLQVEGTTVSNTRVTLGTNNSATAGDLNPGYYVWGPSGTAAYGMKLQYTGTEYGTMMFGPNQANRFLSFGKVGAALEDDDMVEYMRIDLDNGNVGIGTTAPSQKLDVAGYVKGQTGLCIGDDCQTSWPSGSGGTLSVDVNKCTDSDNYSATCSVSCDDATWTRVGCGGYGCQEPSGIKGYGAEPSGSGCRCYVYGRSTTEIASIRCQAICIKIE